MKRYSLSVWMLLVAMLSVYSAWAEPVSEAAALQQARAFLAERGRPDALQTPVLAAGRGDRIQQQSDFYVFNVPDNGGFVVVSGDDRAVPVLGYADQGAIDMNNLPPALQALFRGYSAEIAGVRANGTHGAHRTNGTNDTARRPILPLVQTHWDQNSPYNNLTPLLPNGQQPIIGCVATAVAQVMNYYRWPQAPTQGVPAYISDPQQTLCDSLPPVTFDWDHMLTDYGSNADSTACMAVATLMRYVGQSVHMQYDYGGSGAFFEHIAYALSEYFDYDAAAYCTNRTAYPQEQWISMLYDELAAGHPIPYSFFDVDGGHAVVCDGYDADDYFHFNFGWSGVSDGFYSLSAIYPIAQGNGSYSRGSTFGFDHGALFGLVPNRGGQRANIFQLGEFYLGLYDTASVLSFHREDFQQPFINSTRYLIAMFLLTKVEEEVCDIAIHAFDSAGNYAACLYSEGPDTIMPGNHYYIEPDTIACQLPLGTFSLKLVSRLQGDDEWKPLAMSDQYPITAVIDSFDLTLHTGNPFPIAPKLLDMTLTGPHNTGEIDTLVARVIGVGPFHDELGLFADNSTLLDATFADIAAGDTVSVAFYFKPSVMGDVVLTVKSAKGPLHSDSGNDSLLVHFFRNPMRPFTYYRSDSTDIQFRVEVQNLEGNILHGNAYHTTITLLNPRPDSAFYTYFACSIRMWNPEVSPEGDTTWVMTSEPADPYLAWAPSARDGQPGSVTIPINYDGLANQRDCRVCAHYGFFDVATRSWEDLGWIGFDEQTDTMGQLLLDGYALSDAVDNLSLLPDGDTIDCRDACFADLRVADLSRAVIVPSSNPNCCYCLPEDGPAPAALLGRNIVRISEADTIHLVDGYDFNPYNNILADYVDLTLHVRPNEAVVLPFDPDTLPQGVTVSYAYTDNFGSIAFTPAGDYPLYSFSPCLISVDDPAAGDSLITLTLSASLTPLYGIGSFIPQIGLDYFSFLGAFRHLVYDKAFFLADDATGFVPVEPAVIPPFRAAVLGNLLSTKRLTFVQIEGQGPATDARPEDALRPEAAAVKVLRNGTLYILMPDGTIYTGTGKKLTK